MSPERAYRIVLTRHAERQFGKLPPDAQARLARSLDRLAHDPRGKGVKALRGLAGGYRIRAGDYRALFEIDDDAGEILVRVVGHRREVYGR